MGASDKEVTNRIAHRSYGKNQKALLLYPAIVKDIIYVL
jgi:hypothetical protein